MWRCGWRTLCVSSAKGGCGKSTAAICLAAELALDGTDSLLDCDLNQHATHFGEISNIPGLNVVSAVDERNVLAALRRAQEASDLVVIDLPGGSSTLALKALQRSNFVLIPCQATLPDVRDAVKTVEQIDDAQELARAPIARSLMWSRVLPGFEARSAKHVRERRNKGHSDLCPAMLQRAAFAEFHITGKVPRQIDPDGTAARNIAAVTAELLENLKQLAAAA